MRNKIETKTGLSLEKFSEIIETVEHQTSIGKAPFYSWQQLSASLEAIKDDFNLTDMNSRDIAFLVLDIDENSVKTLA